MIPRACYLGLTLAQPFLVETSTAWVLNSAGSEHSQIRTSLIGAYVLVYLGLAVSGSLPLVRWSILSNHCLAGYTHALLPEDRATCHLGTSQSYKLHFPTPFTSRLSDRACRFSYDLGECRYRAHSIRHSRSARSLGQLHLCSNLSVPDRARHWCRNGPCAWCCTW